MRNFGKFGLSRGLRLIIHSHAIATYWPPFAVLSGRGRSIEFGNDGGALASFASTYGGTSDALMRSTPPFAELLKEVARRNELPLDKPPACTDAVELEFKLALDSRKAARSRRSRQEAEDLPRLLHASPRVERATFRQLRRREERV